MFDKCLMGCDDIEEFEQTWAEMVVKYGLEKHEWFDRLYYLKEKWCPAFSRDIFSAGILSTQRIESTNKAISFKASSSTTLFEFFHIFEGVVARWRSTEVDDMFKNRTQRPNVTRDGCPILVKAAELYTLNIFNDFNHEFTQSLRSYAKVSHRIGDNEFYHVSLYSDFKKSDVVVYSGGEGLKCSCLCFEETGLPCYHILRVMHINNVFDLPSSFVNPRWLKTAKDDAWADSLDPLERMDPGSMTTPWRFSMARSYYKLLCEAQNNKTAQEYMEKNLETVTMAIRVINSGEEGGSSGCPAATTEDGDYSTSTIKDPIRKVVTKGRPKGKGKRIKSHFERRRSKTNRPRHFGTPYSVNEKLI